eukprot:scaffold36547_cov144-Skeletonema_dohrnii-CCMP3373.AAC.4
MSLCSNSTPFSRSAIQGRCANGQTPEFHRTTLLFELLADAEEKLFTDGKITASERRKKKMYRVVAIMAGNYLTDNWLQ